MSGLVNRRTLVYPLCDMAIACVLLMKARQRHLIHISTQYLPRRNYPFLLYPSQTLYNLFSDIDISVYGVYKQPLQLSPRKTCGPDGIPARAPENLAPSIAPWVSFIFQRCYDTGTAPSDWTKALVTAIHKKDSKLTLLIIALFHLLPHVVSLWSTIFLVTLKNIRPLTIS